MAPVCCSEACLRVSNGEAVRAFFFSAKHGDGLRVPYSHIMFDGKNTAYGTIDKKQPKTMSTAKFCAILKHIWCISLQGGGLAE